MASKISLQERPCRHCSRRLIIALALISTLVTAGVAIGLGVGLTRNNKRSMGAVSSSTTSAVSSTSTTSTMSSTRSASTASSTATGQWQPAVGASFQIVLDDALDLDTTSTTVSPNVDVWDIDMFSNSNTTVSYLQSLGKHVICYVDVGTYESYRPDSSEFLASDKGNELDGWPGEYWLNTNSLNVRKIMTARIQTASDLGCDALDPDNVDGYSNDNGLNLTAQDTINYVGFLSDTAALYNMSIGLKNAGDLVDDLLNKTAFSIIESCVVYSECSDYSPFISANKPVFHIEYPKGTNTSDNTTVSSSTASTYCATTGNAAGSTNFSTVMKNIDLDGWVQYCSGLTAYTPISDD